MSMSLSLSIYLDVVVVRDEITDPERRHSPRLRKRSRHEEIRVGADLSHT